MSTLVVHPEDSSTTFLAGIYKDMDDMTLVQGGRSREQLKRLMDNHDRVMMMGHGSPGGLLGVRKFGRAYAVDRAFANTLRAKDNTVFIWCNADKFVEPEQLHGFYTGMFISEVWEAYWMGVSSADQFDIAESNHGFVRAIKGHTTSGRMHAAACHKYGKLTRSNPVAEYNHERLYHSVRKAA